MGGAHGRYFQSKRLPLYAKYAEKLLAKNFAYKCYCTPEQLEKLREGQQEGAEGSDPSAQGYDKHCRNLSESERRAAEASGVPFVIRLKLPPEGSTTYTDVLLGDITIQNKVISPDPVLIKADGFPTYHIANIVDDHLMEITHIMRGQEWLPSAPIYIVFYKALGLGAARVLPSAHGHGQGWPQALQASWLDGVRNFRKQGYLADAFLNCIAMVGWSYDDSREQFTLKELEECFDLKKLSKAPGVFDYQKLEWFNVDSGLTGTSGLRAGSNTSCAASQRTRPVIEDHTVCILLWREMVATIQNQ